MHVRHSNFRLESSCCHRVLAAWIGYFPRRPKNIERTWSSFCEGDVIYRLTDEFKAYELLRRLVIIELQVIILIWLLREVPLLPS